MSVSKGVAGREEGLGLGFWSMGSRCGVLGSGVHWEDRPGSIVEIERPGSEARLRFKGGGTASGWNSWSSEKCLVNPGDNGGVAGG